MREFLKKRSVQEREGIKYIYIIYLYLLLLLYYRLYRSFLPLLSHNSLNLLFSPLILFYFLCPYMTSLNPEKPVHRYRITLPSVITDEKPVPMGSSKVGRRYGDRYRLQKGAL